MGGTLSWESGCQGRMLPQGEPGHRGGAGASRSCHPSLWGPPWLEGEVGPAMGLSRPDWSRWGAGGLRLCGCG